MENARRICVVSATRAEYDLLSPLLRRLRDNPAVELQMVVAGTHLTPEYGATVTAVADDEIPVAARIETVLSSDSAAGSTKSTGLILLGLADALDRLRPELMVVDGDRPEALAAALAAVIARVPLAHIGGGQLTEGAYDDSIRHAVTKLANLHFPATAEFARRIVGMGEDPSAVHVVGSLGIDNVLATPRIGRSVLERELDRALDRPTLVVTYHPATLGTLAPGAAARALLRALEHFPEAGIVFTGTNSDPGGRAVTAEITRFVTRNPERTSLHPSLGRRLYLNLLRVADAVVGNSSSGIFEAPATGTPTVNIGDRQRGRPRPASVFDCPEDTESIVAAIRRALASTATGSAEEDSSYGDGRAAERIADVLTSVDLGGHGVKRFRDAVSEVCSDHVPA